MEQAQWRLEAAGSTHPKGGELIMGWVDRLPLVRTLVTSNISRDFQESVIPETIQVER